MAGSERAAVFVLGGSFWCRCLDPPEGAHLLLLTLWALVGEGIVCPSLTEAAVKRLSLREGCFFSDEHSTF